ncbi:MAG: hypothetical protein AAF288_06330 [Planctomycetota bacterium]
MDPSELNRRRTPDFRPGEQSWSASRRRRGRYHPPSRWVKFLMELLRLPTSPFHEQNILLWVWEFARNRGLPVRADSAGNLIVEFTPEQPDPRLKRLLFTAHMDHIGFWALGEASPGVVRAAWMGRFPESMFEGSKVTFWTGGKPLGEIEPNLIPQGAGASGLRIGGRRVRGVVERVVAYNPAGDVSEVDIAVEGKVEPGSIGMWDLAEPTHLNGVVTAPAIDDVAGVAALVCLMDSFNRSELRRPVSCLFTRCEEGGFLGAIRYCREHFGDVGSEHAGLRPDLVLSVECSRALPLTPLGSGPIVRVGDRRGVFDPEVCAWATRCAGDLAEQHRDFSFQRRLMDGGTCESSVFQAWTGKAGAVCVPMANYHNFNPETGGLDLESIHVGDWGNLIRLMLSMTEQASSAGGVYDGFRDWCQGWEDRHGALFHEPTARAPNDPGPAAPHVASPPETG